MDSHDHRSGIVPEEPSRQVALVRKWKALEFGTQVELVIQSLFVFLAVVGVVIALDQLELGRETTIASERAWVLFDKVRLVARPVNGQPLKVAVGFKNFGNGPAFEVSWSATWSLEEPDRQSSPSLPPAREGVLPPGLMYETQRVEVAERFDPAQRYYVIGQVAYKDQFDLSRTTRVCLWFTAPASDEPNVTFCEHSNNAD